MVALSESAIHVASNTQDAYQRLRDGATRVISGATWILRNPLRGEACSERYVAVGHLQELKGVRITGERVSIGAAVTHAELADAISELPDLKGLWLAAAKSANPAIRAVATVGGNLCTVDFEAPDITTALLALSAGVEILMENGTVEIPIEQFIRDRSHIGGPFLVTAVHVRRANQFTSHQRLPLRVAGDYPVAIVSISVDVSRSAVSVIAVGAVEAAPRRWTSLEQSWQSLGATTETAKEVARDFSGEFTGRDSVEAPGWYRTSVLGALLERAMKDTEEQAKRVRHTKWQ